MKIKPLHDRIIVKPADKETVTASGIILPDSAQEKPLKGTVLAVGPGKQLDNGKLSQMDVKVGDTVLYGKYSGTEVKVEGEDVVILRQDDVLAIIEGAAKKELVGAGKKGKK
ncbi:MAG: co-chaperone GroES [Fimbriimonadales bacterium]